MFGEETDEIVPPGNRKRQWWWIWKEIIPVIDQDRWCKKQECQYNWPENIFQQILKKSEEKKQAQEKQQCIKYPVYIFMISENLI